MKVCFLQGNLGLDFPYIFEGEMIAEIETFFSDVITPATGLEQLKPDFCLELGFYIDEEEKNYTLIVGKTNTPKKEIPAGIRMSAEKLRQERHESLNNFFDMLENAFRELLGKLKTENQSPDFSVLRHKIKQNIDCYYTINDPKSDFNQSMRRLRENV